MNENPLTDQGSHPQANVTAANYRLPRHLRNRQKIKSKDFLEFFDPMNRFVQIKKITGMKGFQNNPGGIRKYKGFQEIPTNLKKNERTRRNTRVFREVIEQEQLAKKFLKRQKKMKREIEQKKGLLQQLKYLGRRKLSFLKSELQIGELNQRLFKITEIGEDKQREMEEEEYMITYNERIQQSEHSCMVIFPDSHIRGLFDLLTFLSVIYSSLMLPFLIVFSDYERPEAQIKVDTVIDCIFLFDILLNFNTGFYSNGGIVMNRRQVAANYLKGWFLLDLISSFPYNQVIQMSSGLSKNEMEAVLFKQLMFQIGSGQKSILFHAPRLIRLLKVARMLKIFKLLRVFKIQKVFLKLEEWVVTDQWNLFMSFLKIMVQVGFIAHWIACAFWGFSSMSLNTEPENWIVNKGLLDVSVGEQYVSALYWAFTTMTTVGYGDFTPQNTQEILFSMFAMIVASGVFAYTLNQIGTIVSRYNMLASEYREKINYVSSFMIQHQMPRELSERIRRYLEYNWDQKKVVKIENKEVMEMLNENLREKITVFLNGRILQNMKFFESNFEIEFLSELTFFFRQKTFSCDDYVFQERDESKEIFYFVSGQISMIHKQSFTYFIDLYTDNYIGEVEFFDESPRFLSARCRDFSDCYTLSKDDFLKCIDFYILSIVKILLILQKGYHQIIDSIENQQSYLILQLKCYICERNGHIALQCEHFPKIKGNLKRTENKSKGKRSDIWTQDSFQQTRIYDENSNKHCPTHRTTI